MAYLDGQSSEGCSLIHVFWIPMLTSAGTCVSALRGTGGGTHSFWKHRLPKSRGKCWLNPEYHSLVLFGGIMAIVWLQSCWEQCLNADLNGPFVFLYSSVFYHLLSLYSIYLPNKGTEDRRIFFFFWFRVCKRFSKGLAYEWALKAPLQ